MSFPTPLTTTTTTTAAGYVDQFGNFIPYSSVPIYTTPSQPQPSGAPAYVPDHRDFEIESLRRCLHEAYAEIGRLHEQVRGMQAFDKWSEGMAAQNKPAP